MGSATMTETIGIFGATGRVGGTAARTLIANGICPRLIVRNANKLPEYLRSAAEIVEADLAQPETVISATAGLETLFWMTPNNFQSEDVRGYYKEMGDRAAQIVKKNSIARVVQLSGAWADQDRFGIISYQRIVEDALRDVTEHHFALRPAYFYENFLLQAQSLNQQGSLFEPFPEDVAIPMVATADIGVEVARIIGDHSWSSHIVQEMRGPEQHTMPSVLAAFGQALDRSFNYVKVPFDGVANMFQSFGSTQSVIDTYLEMYHAFAQGRATSLEGASVIVSKTGAQQFAKTVLAPALNGV